MFDQIFLGKVNRMRNDWHITAPSSEYYYIISFEIPGVQMPHRATTNLERLDLFRAVTGALP